MAPQIQHFIRPTSLRPPSLVSVIIVSALVGLATGAAGFSMLKVWYPNDYTADGVLVGRNTVTIKTEQSLVAAVSALEDQVFGVYQSDAGATGVLSQWRSDKDYLTSAVPVTSDGWLMLPNGSSVSTPLEVVMNQKIYPVTDHYTDSLTGLVFIKILATNLHPIQFASADQIKVGSTLVYQQLTVGGRPLFNRTLVTNDNEIDTTTKNTQVHTTDTMDSWLSLSDNSLRTDIAFTPDGKVAGVVYAPGKLMKNRFVQVAVDKLLNRTPYVSLGFSYVDLYRLPVASATDKVAVGVLVYNAQRPAVLAGSKAQKAGLRSGDIIISLGGEVIGYQTSLMELLVNKKPGDTVLVKIMRNGQEQELTIAL